MLMNLCGSASAFVIAHYKSRTDVKSLHVSYLYHFVMHVDLSLYSMEYQKRRLPIARCRFSMYFLEVLEEIER